MSDQPKHAGRRPRNEHTHAPIRRDMWLQMVAPLVLAVVVTIALLVLVILPGGAGARRPLADISVMLLILPTALMGLVVLALLVGLNYGLILGLRRLPPYFKIAQDFAGLTAHRIQSGIKAGSDAVIRVMGMGAAVGRVAADLGALLTLQRRD